MSLPRPATQPRAWPASALRRVTGWRLARPGPGGPRWPRQAAASGRKCVRLDGVSPCCSMVQDLCTAYDCLAAPTAMAMGGLPGPALRGAVRHRRVRAVGLLTGRLGPSVDSARRAGLVLLIVMYEARTWRVRPDERFTFGRPPECSAVLPAADRGVSRTAGSFRFHGGSWWLHNDSRSSVLSVQGTAGSGRTCRRGWRCRSSSGRPR